MVYGKAPSTEPFLQRHSNMISNRHVNVNCCHHGRVRLVTAMTAQHTRRDRDDILTDPPYPLQMATTATQYTKQEYVVRVPPQSLHLSYDMSQRSDGGGQQLGNGPYREEVQYQPD